MIKEIFSQGDSFIHHLDPRVRVIIATWFAFVVAVGTNISCLFAALFISWALVFFAALPLKELAKRLAAVNGMVLLLWAVLPLTLPGDPLYRYGLFTISKQGVLLSLAITLKSNAIVMAFIALVATMDTTTLGHSLDGIHVPGKIVHLFLLTYRYIFVIHHEYTKLITAAKIRSFKPGTNIHTYRTLAYLIGMLFVRASARAVRVHNAMVCRGFNKKFYSLFSFSLTSKDIFWYLSMAVLITVLEFFQWANIL